MTEFPPAEIKAHDISEKDMYALDARLDVLSRVFQNWIIFSEKGNPTADEETFVLPPTWPCRRQLREWVKVMQQARTMLPVSIKYRHTHEA